VFSEKVRQIYVWSQIDDEKYFVTPTKNTEFKKYGVCEIEGLLSKLLQRH